MKPTTADINQIENSIPEFRKWNHDYMKKNRIIHEAWNFRTRKIRVINSSILTEIGKNIVKPSTSVLRWH